MMSNFKKNACSVYMFVISNLVNLIHNCLVKVISRCTKGQRIMIIVGP